VVSRIQEPESVRHEGRARFSPGEIVHHERFGYRGVVVDVDPVFMLTDEWYDQMARSRPPKDRPWYHVLVDDATHTTYVAERNLAADETGVPIRHPLLSDFFDSFEDGRYQRERPMN
jgi:heat shock protein HspQ